MTPDVLLSMNKNFITVSKDLLFKAWKGKGDEVPYREYSIKSCTVEIQSQQIVEPNKFLVFQMPNEHVQQAPHIDTNTNNDIWVLMNEEIAREWEELLGPCLAGGGSFGGKAKSPNKKHVHRTSTVNPQHQETWSKEILAKMDALSSKMEEVSGKVDKIYGKIEQLEQEVNEIKEKLEERE